jgi:hypothetical protein
MESDINLSDAKNVRNNQINPLLKLMIILLAKLAKRPNITKTTNNASIVIT